MLGSRVRFEQNLLRGIDLLAARLGRVHSETAPHLATGLRGEEEAFFYLRSLGYVVVARRWRTPKVLGDVDLIAWDGATLCLIEVKTRTGRNIVPAEFAVDEKKQKMLRSMAAAYSKRFPDAIRRELLIRFDVVSVYFAAESGLQTEIELFRGAFDRQPRH